MSKSKPSRPQMLSPSSPRLAAGLQYFLKIIPHISVFAAQIDQPVSRTKRVAGNRHAVENQIREFGQQNPILKGARLALVGVADDIMLVAGRLAGEAPFHAGGKAGAAAAAQLGVGDFFDHFIGRAGQGSLDHRRRRPLSPDKSGPGCTRLDRTCLAFRRVCCLRPCRSAATICGTSSGVSPVRIIPFMSAAGS